MRNRLIFLIVITGLLGVFVSVFTFGVIASAEVIIEDNSATIEAGTYRFNDDLTHPDNYVIDVTLPFTCTIGEYILPGTRIWDSSISGDYFTISYELTFPESSEPVSAPVYDSGWIVFDTGDTLQTISVTEDTTFTDTDGIAFATWFLENTTQDTPTPPSATVTFDSGYYGLKVPYVNIEASWIGESGQSVYYPIQCQVVNGFNDYVECNGFGIEYISNDNGYTTLWYVDIAGLRYDWFSLVTVQGADGVHTTSLRLLGGDYGLNTTMVYFPSSFEMEDGPGAVQFFSTFEVTDAPPYEGNVFFDIVDAVVEALDVDVFGYFSPLDVIKSIAGLMLGLWLLKLLAGG